MQWKAWLLYFEECCKNSNKDNVLKIWNTQKILKGWTLTLYINNSLNVLHWEELIQLFNEEFIAPGLWVIFQSLDLKQVKMYQNVIKKRCMQKKLYYWTLNYCYKVLTDGLYRELKQLIIVNSLEFTTESWELVYRLNKLKIMDNTQNKTYRFYPVNYDNWNPSYFR